MQINLTPDFSLLVIMAIFIANYWVVRSFFIKPVNDILVSRDQDVRGAEKLYEEALARFNHATATMDARLQETRREAAAVRETHRGEASEHRARVMETTRLEAEKIVAVAEQELRASVDSAREKVLRDADLLARQAAEKILGRQVA